MWNWDADTIIIRDVRLSQPLHRSEWSLSRLWWCCCNGSNKFLQSGSINHFHPRRRRQPGAAAVFLWQIGSCPWRAGVDICLFVDFVFSGSTQVWQSGLSGLTAFGFAWLSLSTSTLVHLWILIAITFFIQIIFVNPQNRPRGSIE